MTLTNYQLLPPHHQPPHHLENHQPNDDQLLNHPLELYEGGTELIAELDIVLFI